MGGTFSHLLPCFKHQEIKLTEPQQPLDEETLGHSFCYIRSSSSFISPCNSDRFTSLSYSLHYSHAPPPKNTTFKSISGGSVSANALTPTIQLDNNDQNYDYATSGFESTSSLSALPLQPLPRGESVRMGGYFMSGPIERGSTALSGPLDSNSLNLGLGNSNGVAYPTPLNGGMC